MSELKKQRNNGQREGWKAQKPLSVIGSTIKLKPKPPMPKTNATFASRSKFINRKIKTEEDSLMYSNSNSSKSLFSFESEPNRLDIA